MTFEQRNQPLEGYKIENLVNRVEFGRARKELRDVLAEETSLARVTERALERLNMSLQEAKSVSGVLRPTCTDGLSEVDSACEAHRNTHRTMYDSEPITEVVATIESFQIYSSPDENISPKPIRVPVVTVEIKDAACHAPMQARYDEVEFGFEDHNA